MRSPNPAHQVKWWQDLPLIGFWLAFVIALGAMIVVSSLRQLSQLEVILFQVVTLVAGLLGSYRFGRNVARDAAYDVIRPHARSALRSILALRDSLYNLSVRIERFRESEPNHNLDLIQAVIAEQIPLAGSAVEDWRDVAPKDVAAVIKNWPPGREDSSNDNAD